MLLYTNDMAGALKNAEELIATNTYPLLPNEPAPEDIEKDMPLCRCGTKIVVRSRYSSPSYRSPNEQAASIPLYGADYDMYRAPRK